MRAGEPARELETGTSMMASVLKAAKHAIPRPVRVFLSRVFYRRRSRPFKPYLKRKNVEGVVFDFWIGDRDGRDWYDLQCTDPVWVELRFIRDHLVGEGDVVLECGGHHGCTAVVLLYQRIATSSKGTSNRTDWAM
jgi:hypothetical protein